MGRLNHTRLATLERRMHLDGPPVGRLLFLIPDLWPAAERAAFVHPASTEALADLVERRTGVRPTFGMRPCWAITVPVTEAMLAMSDDEKATFLAAHESRPLAPDPWAWRAAPVDGHKDRG